MRPPWAKNPRVLAGRLRRAFLRMLDIEIGFGREARSGARMIRMSALGQAKPVVPQCRGTGKAMDIVLMGEDDHCSSKHRQYRQQRKRQSCRRC